MLKISYKPLWKLLIDKDMKNKELIEKAGLSSSTLYKLKHNNNVTTAVLVRICEALDCEFSDIMCCEEEKVDTKSN